MTDDTTDVGDLFTDVYSRLDANGGALDTLANALAAADDAGFDTESHDDRRADIDNGCQRAFEMMDEEDDPDPGDVLDWVEHAESAASEFVRGLPDDLGDFELPDHVDSGVHDTLDGFAEYVHSDLRELRAACDDWADAAEDALTCYDCGHEITDEDVLSSPDVFVCPNCGAGYD